MVDRLSDETMEGWREDMLAWPVISRREAAEQQGYNPQDGDDE